ncbi:MAG: cupin domain-containing protein [Deltaproteobacteria bacterium]|nr:cupin domain-containing protein [Deltaproteobacteria bacterium]
MISEKDIGKRIKEIRTFNGMTLEILAEKTSFTKGYLSKVENSEKSPPVSTLIKIAGALEVQLSEIFQENEGNDLFSLVRKNERRVMARNGSKFGYYYETLAHTFTKKSMDPYILTQPVDPEEVAIFQHEGEEILFMLEGKMQFVHGNKEHILEEGDCVYFDAGIPHYGVTLEDKPSKCFMVIYTPNKKDV